MPVFKGTTSSVASEIANDIPSGVLSFSVVMTAAGALDIYIGAASVYVNIFSATTLDFKDKVYNDSPITVLSGQNIYLVTDSSCDYYFSIE